MSECEMRKMLSAEKFIIMFYRVCDDKLGVEMRFSIEERDPFSRK